MLDTAPALPPAPEPWCVSDGMGFTFPAVEKDGDGRYLVTTAHHRWSVMDFGDGDWVGRPIRHYTEQPHPIGIEADNAADIIATIFTHHSDI